MGTVYVNRDWTAIVPEGSPEAAFGVQPKDLKRLGLDRLAPAVAAIVEQAEPAAVMTTANEPATDDAPDTGTKAEQPPEDKQAEPVEDKAMRKPRTK